TFQAIQHYNAGSSPAVSDAGADFNRDGAPDIGAALPFADSVGTLLNSQGRSGDGARAQLTSAASKAEHPNAFGVELNSSFPAADWRPVDVRNADPGNQNHDSQLRTHRFATSSPVWIAVAASSEEWEAF